MLIKKTRPSPNESLNLQNSIFQNSLIFTDDLKTNESFKILPNFISKTKLLYRLSQNGAGSKIFHQLCDGKNPYIVFIEANGFKFGYFMPISFVSCEKYSTCEDCWIFSLKNKLGFKPIKFSIKPDRRFIALYQSDKNPCLGSTIEQKQDLMIKFVNSMYINYYF